VAEPRSLRAARIPDPPRPLGDEGRKSWDRLWALARPWIERDADLEHVLLLCESLDERVGLRVRVLRSNEWRDRLALRHLDDQVASLIGALGLNPADRERISTGVAVGTGKLAQLRAAR